MKRNKNWKWKRGIFINGCNSVALLSWRVLPDFLVRHGYQFPKYVFRGQSYGSYELMSSLGRALRNQHNQDPQKYLENFRLSIRGRLNLKDQEFLTDKELWLWGQQHGLKTPLLEWTQSPYVALFFAFYSPRQIRLRADATLKEFRRAKEHQDEPRVIFILNQHLIEQRRRKFRLEFVRKAYPKLYETIKEMAGNLVSINDPYYLDKYIDKILRKGSNVAYSSKLINACETATWNRDHFLIDILHPTQTTNPQFLAQGSMYTIGPLELSMEEWVKANFSGSENDVLLKITIPDDDREECLQTLNQMNINNLGLYPDVDGSAKYCNDLLRGLYPP